MHTDNSQQKVITKYSYFFLRGFSALHNFRGKQTDLEVERLSLNQMEVLYK